MVYHIYFVVYVVLYSDDEFDDAVAHRSIHLGRPLTWLSHHNNASIGDAAVAVVLAVIVFHPCPSGLFP